MLEILDTAGSEQFASLQDLYIRNGEAFLLVFSLASLQSLLDLDPVHQQILRFKTSPSKSRGNPPGAQGRVLPPPPPMVLVGNKADLDAGLREVAREQAEDLARRWGCCAFVETSAKTGQGVADAFRAVVLKVVLQSSRQPPLFVSLFSMVIGTGHRCIRSEYNGNIRMELNVSL